MVALEDNKNMLNNLIFAKRKSLFEKALNNDEVLDEAIVFIEDTKEIWNHGTYFGDIPAVNHGTSNTTFELTPNVYHKWDTVADLTLTLANAPEDTYNEYMFQFTSGDTATTLSVPNTIQWVMQPNILSNRTYQCSIVNNIGVLVIV